MKLEELSIVGCYEITSAVFPDSRGLFFEWFNKSSFAEKNLEISVAQANFSTSAKGVIRGIHYSLASTGQSKIVMCAAGSINDVLVDLRVGSPTFLNTINISLSANTGKMVFIATGVGHGFSVVSQTASVTYLMSSEYLPDKEHAINPLDIELAIDWSLPRKLKPILSDRDRAASSLEQAIARNLLPTI